MTALTPRHAQAILVEETKPGSNPPPDVGAMFFSDPTFSIFGSFKCPSGRNTSEPVGEGYILKVTGKCDDESTIALAFNWITDLLVPDGEVRFDFKVVTGHDRASVILGFRTQSDFRDYEAAIVPGSGLAGLYRGDKLLAARRDLSSVISRDDWNTLAVRMRGSDLWLLVNDQLVLQANDSTYDRGHVSFALRRMGDINDSPETAAVLRNLRVSSLATGDPSRAPSEQQAGAPTAPSPPASVPDQVGLVVPDEGRAHKPQGTPIQYQNVPPSSGTHYPIWTRPGVYAEPQETGNWVHSLEHGYIVILYNCAEPCSELAAQLTAFYESAPPSAKYAYQKLIIAPFAAMSRPIIAVAWNRRLELDHVDADQLMAFFRAYQDRGPEDAG